MSDTGPRRIAVVTPDAQQLILTLRGRADAEVVERFELSDVAGDAELCEGLRGVWAVVAGGEHYSRAVFEGLPDLRVIVRFGAGYDAIDLAAASAAGVAVFTTPGANAEPVADMAVALMLAVVRGVPCLDSAVRAGRWRPGGLTRDLALATVAIVGLGAIGQAVARRLRGFGAELLGVEPEPDAVLCAELGIELTALDDALRRADVVTLHAALTSGTHHLLGARELALLPAHAVVINTSRGGLIDQAALLDALAAGRLGGAGLDVVESPPLAPEDPLLALPGVLVTGHMAASTELAISRTSEAVLARLTALLDGNFPTGCLSAPGWG